MTVLKIKTDIITYFTSNPIERAVILVIMHVETIKQLTFLINTMLLSEITIT